MPDKPIKAGHYRPIRETPCGWHFAGSLSRPTVTQFMLAEEVQGPPSLSAINIPNFEIYHVHQIVYQVLLDIGGLITLFSASRNSLVFQCYGSYDFD